MEKVLESKDGVDLIEETLTDGSKVYNLRLYDRHLYCETEDRARTLAGEIRRLSYQ